MKQNSTLCPMTRFGVLPQGLAPGGYGASDFDPKLSGARLPTKFSEIA
jgi:hypothetical protein